MASMPAVSVHAAASATRRPTKVVRRTDRSGTAPSPERSASTSAAVMGIRCTPRRMRLGQESPATICWPSRRLLASAAMRSSASLASVYTLASACSAVQYDAPATMETSMSCGRPTGKRSSTPSSRAYSVAHAISSSGSLSLPLELEGTPPKILDNMFAA
jgi:hypothetical protein